MRVIIRWRPKTLSDLALVSSPRTRCVHDADDVCWSAMTSHLTAECLDDSDIGIGNARTTE